MSNQLLTALRNLKASGPEGFEGLISQLLERLTGQRFRLAKSGSQLGRDISSRELNTNIVAVECKRYGQNRDLNDRELLGELAQVTDDMPDLDIWVLIASTPVSSQLYEALHRGSNKNGIKIITISTSDGKPSSLETLCAQGSDITLSFLEKSGGKASKGNKISKSDLEDSINNIKMLPQYSPVLDQLRADFLSPLVGYDAWRFKQNQWFRNALQSEAASYTNFGQIINIEQENIEVIERKSAWSKLDSWIADWGNNPVPFILLGDEGDGKTWCVASWLNERLKKDSQLAPIIFLSSSDVDVSEPIDLLSKSALRYMKESDDGQWSRRINRWFNRKPDGNPDLLLVIDGINERRGASWWRSVLENLSNLDWYNRIAVIVTCRLAYWQNYSDVFNRVKASLYTLPPYDDNELATALTKHNLKPSDIPISLLNLVKKPRYLDLLVRHRKNLKTSGDVTIARLIYEDWRDRLSRKRSVSLGNKKFQNLISELAQKYQEGYKKISEQEIEQLIPPFEEDKQSIFHELTTGGILKSKGRHYEVNQDLLPYGLGLILADQVYEAVEQERDLDEAIAEWLEPQAEMDIKASICSFAALHVLFIKDYPKSAKVALLNAWINSTNPDINSRRNFIAHFPLDPSVYIALAEVVWSDARDNRWAQEILMYCFLHWYELLETKDVLDEAFDYWLGFVHITPNPYLGQLENPEKTRQELYDRIGFEVQPGTFSFAGYTLTAIEDEGLLRLGKVALAIISHLPRGHFLHSITKGCLSDAIMNWHNRYELISWLLRSSSESILDEVIRETNILLNTDHTVAKRTARRLLSLEGSEATYELMQRLLQDLLPSNPLLERHQEDPCISVFSWSKEECELCVQRTDLEIQRIVRKLEEHAMNPALIVPDDLGARISPLLERIDTQNMWTLLGRTEADATLDMCETSMYAFAPKSIASLIKGIVPQINQREGMALRQLSIALSRHYLIFTEQEHQIIYQAWDKLIATPSPWTDNIAEAEEYLFRIVLKQLSAEQQLSHFLKRPMEAIDVLVLKSSFLPITDWAFVSYTLNGEAITNHNIARLLWFLAQHPNSIPENIIYEQIYPLVENQESLVRLMAMEILYKSKHLPSIEQFINGPWNWNENNKEVENQWGSLLLCEYGNALPYEEIRSRIEPIYLGYAVYRRGLDEREVNQYANDIHLIWRRLGSDVPDVPETSSFVTIEADHIREKDISMIHMRDMSRSLFSKTTVFQTRNATWGGIIENAFNLNDWNEDLTLNIDRRQKDLVQDAQKIIEEQINAGNTWFARRFSPEALDKILEIRPDLIEEWLSLVHAQDETSRRRLHLGRSFYDALCTMLLEHSAEKGISLYELLKKKEAFVQIRDYNTGIKLIDYDLFEIPPSEGATSSWTKQLESCRTDKDLMEVVILSQNGNGREWLWSYVTNAVTAASPLQRARGITLLGFIDTDESLNLLRELFSQLPDTWMKDLVQISLKRWNKNSWAKHWYHRFVTQEDNIEAWAAFKLFSLCVDRRFWFWKRAIEAEANLFYTSERYRFYKENRDNLENRIQKNEEKLEKHFLGHKVMDREIWPWM